MGLVKKNIENRLNANIFIKEILLTSSSYLFSFIEAKLFICLALSLPCIKHRSYELRFAEHSVTFKYVFIYSYKEAKLNINI